MNEDFMDSFSKECKKFGKDKEVFLSEYRKKNNCRVICGKPYCDRMVNACNRHFKERADALVLSLAKFSRGEIKLKEAERKHE